MVFKPFDTIDKADVELVHDKFDGIKILSAWKASGKIMRGIDGSFKTTAYGAGKGQIALFLLAVKAWQGFNNLLDGDPIS